MRESFFVEGEYFHLFNKSIAGFGIYKDPRNSQRFINVLDYYNSFPVTESYSKAIIKKQWKPQNLLYPKKARLIKFISYCIMPDHYHLVVKIFKNHSVSKFINDIENSYTHYFNLKFKRKGPLWQSSFKSVHIKSNEQLLHVTRYVHLNPTTSNLVQKPEDWPFSSYREFINNVNILKKYVTDISISNHDSYQKFVENQKDYQRKLKLIKKLLLD